MSSAPAISVIIPCHQAAGTLPLQLRALASQLDAPPFELLIVDNRSTDGLAAVVEEHRSALLAAGATAVRLLDAHVESGASYARNVGASHASTDFLVFCDADDCVSARWLADALALFEQADAFSGSALPIPDPEFGTDISALRDRIAPAALPAPEVRHQQELAIPILMGGDFGMRRSLYLQLGGFDQALPSAGEDNDLAIRLRAAGHPVLDSYAMRIAYRTRETGRARRLIARRAASTHVLLCQRYGVYRSSAFVGRGRLLIATVKLPAAALTMLLKPGPRDLDGFLARAAGVQGFWTGVLRYRVFRRVPRARLGVGLEVSVR